MIEVSAKVTSLLKQLNDQQNALNSALNEIRALRRDLHTNNQTLAMQSQYLYAVTQHLHPPGGGALHQQQQQRLMNQQVAPPQQQNTVPHQLPHQRQAVGTQVATQQQ